MKRIFISRSSKDADVAMNLCELLEKNGLLCWIAPRDISYGEKWAEQIADSLINDTSLFVFILSENSNKSGQVLKEINIALNYDVPLIAISIQKVKKINLSLVYYLSNLHILECFTQDNDTAINYMADIVAKRYNDRSVKSKGSLKTRKEVDFDKELEYHFNQLFNQDESAKTEKKKNVSEIRNRLYNIIGENTVTSWAKAYKEQNEKDTVIQQNIYDDFDPFHISLAPCYFTLQENPGQFTLVYQINRMIHPDTHKVYYRAVYLEDAPEYKNDGTILHTYFAEKRTYDGNHLVIVTLDDKNNLILINNGFLDYDQVKISKKPTIIQRQELLSKTSEAISQYYSSMDTPYCIIDQITKKPVSPYLVYNEEKGSSETCLDLVSNHRYLAFTVHAKNGENTADNYDIGYGHYKGLYGLERNWLLAAEYFMQSEKPQAYYYLGVIFLKDPLLHSEKLADEYINKAIDNGIEQAEELLEILQQWKNGCTAAPYEQ